MNTHSIYNGFKSTCSRLYFIPKQDDSFDVVVRIVCAKMNVNEFEVYGKSRLKDICGARHIIFYILSTSGNYTLSKISKHFGKDHSTVIHSRNACQGWIDVDPKYKKLIETLKASVELARLLQ